MRLFGLRRIFGFVSDCHNFSKFVSKVNWRQLSLRDNNRFHMMVGDSCSLVVIIGEIKFNVDMIS